MVRRALVLALALVTMGAPLALTVCQVLCAGHDATHASADTPVAHSCHGNEASEAAVTVTAVPHVCGHTSEAPSGLEQWVQALAAPVAVPVAFTVYTPPMAASLVAQTVTIDTSPPGSFALISQLRV